MILNPKHSFVCVWCGGGGIKSFGVLRNCTPGSSHYGRVNFFVHSRITQFGTGREESTAKDIFIAAENNAHLHSRKASVLSSVGKEYLSISILVLFLHEEHRATKNTPKWTAIELQSSEDPS